MIKTTNNVDELQLTETSVIADNILEKLARYCFPTRESDIRLYSCLAHGNDQEYLRGVELYRRRRVSKAQQIGPYSKWFFSINDALQAFTYRLKCLSRNV